MQNQYRKVTSKPSALLTATIPFTSALQPFLRLIPFTGFMVFYSNV